MGEIIERIPHKSVAYAFLEIRAGSGNEFESLRADALKRAPHYGFAAEAPKAPKASSPVDSPQKQEADEAAAENAGAPVEKPTVAAEPDAPAPTEGLSPREKAKAKLAAKKGA